MRNYKSSQLLNQSLNSRLNAKKIGNINAGNNKFKITSYIPLPDIVNLVLISYTTTDPDNQSGDNGTATINFEGDRGPFTYTLDGGGSIPCTSPIVLTGLSESITYNVVITDALRNSIKVEFKLGESGFGFDADWIMVTYQFSDGEDLDTRSRIVTPDIGQVTQKNMVGYYLYEIWPPDAHQAIIQWSGDNIGLGFESILINLNNLKTQYPSEKTMVADLRCLWYDDPSTPGILPVECSSTLWKGGLPILDVDNYIWSNPTATAVSYIDSVSLVIPSSTPDGVEPPPYRVEDSTGWRLATLTYNLETKIGVFNNADITTPNVPVE